MTIAAARVELQRSLMDAEQRQQGANLAIQYAKQEQWQTAERIRKEAVREQVREDEQRQKEQSAAEIQQAQQEQAVRFCMAKVNQRFSDLASHGTGTQKATANIQRGLTNIAYVCTRDPTYYASMPAVPTTTHCQGNNDFGNVDISCTSN